MKKIIAIILSLTFVFGLVRENSYQVEATQDTSETRTQVNETTSTKKKKPTKRRKTPARGLTKKEREQLKKTAAAVGIASIIILGGGYILYTAQDKNGGNSGNFNFKVFGKDFSFGFR